MPSVTSSSIQIANEKAEIRDKAIAALAQAKTIEQRLTTKRGVLRRIPIRGGVVLTNRPDDYLIHAVQ